MKCKISAISAAACSVLLTSSAALAQGKSTCAPGTNQSSLISFYSTAEPTGSPTPGGNVNNLGHALAGGFYGNTSNAGSSPYAPDNGHGVTPSISPGPQTVGGTFTSIGASIQQNCPPN